MKILYIETFRDAFGNVFGTTMLYEFEGKVCKIETKEILKTNELLRQFVEQTNCDYNDLKKGGYIKEYLIGDLENGNYKTEIIYGHKFPNISVFFRNRRVYKHDKYTGPITWIEMEENKEAKANKRNKIVPISKKKKINIRALLLALLMTGAISLATVKGIKYISSNPKSITATNFNGNIDERFISRIFKNFISDNEHNVSEEELNMFVEKIHEMYNGNFYLWNDSILNKSRIRSAVSCNFSNHFEEGTKDREVLEYFENNYNSYIDSYLGPSSMNYKTNMSWFCNELYNFVIKKETFRKTNIRFSELSLPTQLIILEMFENCADTIDFYYEDYYALSKQHEQIYNSQVMNQISSKKDSVIGGMEYSIELTSKIRK